MLRTPSALLCALLLGPAPAAAAAPHPPPCRASGLSVRHRSPTAGLGHGGFVLILTNRSSRTCLTGGYVGMLRLDRRRRPVRTVVRRGSGYLFRSRRPHTISLAPGKSASAGVEWINVRITSDRPDCARRAFYLEVTPPNETRHLTVPARVSACDGGFLGTTALVAGSRGPSG